MEVNEVVEILYARLKTALVRFAEVGFRIPGVMLFEIWWRNRNVEPQMGLFKGPFSSRLELDGIIGFIKSRNFDETAAQILSYSS